MGNILDLPALTEDECRLLTPNRAGEVYHAGQVRLCYAAPPRAAIGDVPHAKAFPEKLIPRSEWDAIIARKDAEKSWLYDRIIAEKIPCKDQDGLGYCHAYGNVQAAELARCLQGHPYIPLSAESLGGPVTGWRNRGADPSDDLAQLATAGACPASMMDAPHSLNPRRWKAGWEAAATHFVATEIWDGRDGNGSKMFDLAVTACLLDVPGGVGWVWWSHFVHGFLRVRKIGSRYEALSRNQWGSDFGNDGFFWLPEGKGTPDWATYIRQMTAVDA